MACVDRARSKDEPTDDDVIIQCRPCKKAGLVRDASKYCPPCKEFMCESCVTIHRRFRESENHNVVPVHVSNLTSFGQSSMTKPLIRLCNVHKDNDLEWYCATHDVLLCDTCRRTNHRKCQAMTILEMAKVSPKLFTTAVESMAALHCRIKTLKTGRQESTKALKSLERSLIVDVKKLKTRLVEMVEQLEAEILADIDKFVAAETGVIMDHVKTCDDMIPQLETALGVADEAKAVGDEVTSMISGLNLSKTLKEFEPTVSAIQQDLYSIDISFVPSRTLTDMLGQVDRLGTLKTARTAIADRPYVVSSTYTCRPVLPAPSRVSWPDVKVQSSTGINVLSNIITGSAIMPDGRIVLADRSNKKIILLDVNFNMQSKLTLPSWPYGVAVDGTNDVIVSVPQSKQLQWIHVTTSLRASRTVTMGKSCCGIAVYKGEIYTCVGNIHFHGEFGYKPDGDAFVQVLDRAGTVIRSIGLDANGNSIFTLPRYITVSAGGRVFVSDCDQDRITCFTNGGDVLYDVRGNKNIRYPRGLLADEDGNLLVCCSNSNDVRVLTKDGTFTKVLLTSADGVVCPRSVSYRHSDSTLIITMWNKPPCRAYKLKYN